MILSAAQVECVACGATVDPALDACSSCGAALFAPQRRVVSVLFADLTGYTQLCAELDPEEVHLLIRPLMNALRRVCQELGGVVPSIAGDGFMAVFGARTSDEQDPVRAVVAATRLQRTVSERRAAFDRIPELRVGISAGEVLVAPSWEPGGFSVHGDVVNVGQRLCTAAPAGGVLVSLAAARLVPAMATMWSDAEPHLLRNRAEAVSARLLDWAALPPDLLMRRAPSTGPLVGRSAETTRLDALLEAAQGDAAVVVTGDAGIGKTRLVDVWTDQHGERRVLRTACLSFGDSDLAPLRGLVAAALAELDADAAVRTLPSLTQRQARRLLAGAQRADGDGDDDDALVSAAVALLVELSRRKPTIVVVDDAQWAGPPTLTAIARLSDQTGPGLCLLVTSRTPVNQLSGLPRLELGALADAAATELVERYLPGATPEVLAFVLDRAGGNPLYVEHCATLLVEDGSVVPSEDGYRAAPGGLRSSSIPTSMRLFVGARLDLLERAERSALEAATVLGDVVELDALAELVPDARAAVDRLVARGHLRWSSDVTEVGGTLEFSHALVRDVAYAAQTRGARQTTHRAAASWYGRRDDLRAVELRASHLEAALALAPNTGDDCDLVREAFAALVRQAEVGMTERLRSTRAALARAGELLARHEPCGLDPFRYWLAMSRVASITGDAEAGLRAADHASSLAAADDPAGRAEAALARGDALWAMTDTAAGASAYGAARRLFGSAGDAVGAARAALGQAHCAEVANGLRQAIVALRNAHDVALRSDSRPVALLAAEELALLSYIDGPASVEPVLQTVEAMRDGEDELALTRMSLARAAVHVHALDSRAAVDAATDAVRRAQDLQDGRALFNSVLLLLEAQLLDGQLDAAEETLTDCLATAATRPTRRMHVSTTLISALLHSRRGRHDAAIAALVDVTDDVEALGLAFERDHTAFRTYVSVEAGHFDDAITHGLRTVALDWLLDQPFLALRPRLAVLAACVATGRSPEDETTSLREDAARMGGAVIDGLAARWLAQDALLAGREPGPVETPADIAEARALDLENAALRSRDANGFAAAAEVWAELGDTVWLARALLWHGAIAPSNDSTARGIDVLARLGSPHHLADAFTAQVSGIWR
ncbi:MAG: hypothetical protein QOJ79_2523 [Actinomycetota bacterium]|nr:hypothetical protein [Actinomycetota bacterium]